MPALTECALKWFPFWLSQRVTNFFVCSALSHYKGKLKSISKCSFNKCSAWTKWNSTYCMPSQCRNDFGVDSVWGDLIFELIESSRKYLKSYGIVCLGPWDHNDLDRVKHLFLVWPFKGTLAWDVFLPHHRICYIGRFLTIFSVVGECAKIFQQYEDMKGSIFQSYEIAYYKGP